ncbi:MAG: dethiobiotin synthase [Thermodesulfobacteriota bacterium]
MPLPNLIKVKGVFVTGTDTGVGKTWIAAGITAVLRGWGLSACYFKPVQSGCPEENGKLIPTDARFARELAGLDEPLDLLTPVTLRLPLAPGVAAVYEGVEVDLDRITQAREELAGRYELLVTEGAGGLYVPLTETNFLVLDMIRWLRLPLIVVARAGLGTINHTALTVKAAQHAGVPVAGVVINRYPEKPSLAEETNPEVIAALTNTPILGKVPEISPLSTPAGKKAFLAAMEQVCHTLAQASAARAFLKYMVTE